MRDVKFKMKKEDQDLVRQEAIRTLAKNQSSKRDFGSYTATTNLTDPLEQKTHENNINRLLEPGYIPTSASNCEEPYETKKVVIVVLAALATVGIGFLVYRLLTGLIN